MHSRYKVALRFIKFFLLHAIVVWLFLNLVSWLEYVYAVHFNLAYSVNADGSMVSEKDRFVNDNFNQPLCLWILLLAFLAEFNLRFVAPKASLVKFVAGSVLLGLLGSLVTLLFARHRNLYPETAEFLTSWISIAAYIAGYAILFDFFRERYRRVRLKQQQTESELNLLKAQIDPHFFFNTLNNLYGIALTEHATDTATGIELLSQMMRYSMDGNNAELISLDKEIAFLKNYWELQQLRVPRSENINIQLSINNSGHTNMIAPMLLIPLVENAWKYGISIEQLSFVRLTLNADDQKLTVLIENSNFPGNEKKGGTGLGVANVIKRLRLLYPDKHQLLAERTDTVYRVELTIEL